LAFQDGYYWACACVPSGRITADDYLAFADIADRYGNGTARATVECNILFPFIPESKLEDLKVPPPPLPLPLLHKPTKYTQIPRHALLSKLVYLRA